MDSESHSYPSYNTPNTTLSIVVLSDAARPQIIFSLSIKMSIVIITVSIILLIFFSAAVLSRLKLTVVVCRVMWM